MPQKLPGQAWECRNPCCSQGALFFSCSHSAQVNFWQAPLGPGAVGTPVWFSADRCRELWIGGSDAARQARWLRIHGITHKLCCDGSYTDCLFVGRGEGARGEATRTPSSHSSIYTTIPPTPSIHLCILSILPDTPYTHSQVFASPSIFPSVGMRTLCTCMDMHAHTCTCACVSIHAHAHASACMCAGVHACMRECLLACLLACMRVYVHARMPAQASTHAHTDAQYSRAVGMAWWTSRIGSGHRMPTAATSGTCTRSSAKWPTCSAWVQQMRRSRFCCIAELASGDRLPWPRRSWP